MAATLKNRIKKRVNRPAATGVNPLRRRANPNNAQSNSLTREQLMRILQNWNVALRNAIRAIEDPRITLQTKRAVITNFYNLIRDDLARILNSRPFQSTNTFGIETAFWVKNLCCIRQANGRALIEFLEFETEVKFEAPIAIQNIILGNVIRYLQLLRACKDEILFRLRVPR